MFSKETITILSLCSEPKLVILQELYFCLDEKCGCDLVDALEMPKNLLSYHMKTLRDMNYIEERRCGQRKFYRINPAKRQKISQLFNFLEIERTKND